MNIKDYIIWLVSEKYEINLCTPYSVKKEAVDVCAYMLKKHTDMKHKAIALTLGSTAKSTNLIKCITIVKNKRNIDAEFNTKLAYMDVAITQNNGALIYNKS